MNFRCGVIAILGKPNVGKSSLLNSLVGEKIAAVTDKPQTTRTKISGIIHRAGSQMIFLDTPGFHEGTQGLNRWMLQQVSESSASADVLIMMHNAQRRWEDRDQVFYDKLKKINKPLLVAINKIDRVPKPSLLPLLKALHEKGVVNPLLICARSGEGCDLLLEKVEMLLPESPPIYKQDELTDQTMRQIASELIREKIFEETHQEIPYSVAVMIEEYKEPTETDSTTRIAGVILVEKESQKPIIIGKKGQRLKIIGSGARQALQALIEGKIFLSLYVKVSKDWTLSDLRRKDFGYG
jgi:GTPase